MFASTEINVTGADQGLNEIFKKTEMQQPLALYFQESCGIKTSSDFLKYVPAASYETELAEIVKGAFLVKEDFKVETQRLYVARARAAFQLALEVSNKLTAINAKPKTEDTEQGDLERPLDADALVAMEARWAAPTPRPKSVHHLRPSPPFRNRIYRELQKKSNRFVPVEKARSLEDHRVQSDPVEVALGGSQGSGPKIILGASAPSRKAVSTLLEYLTALRLIMMTYSYCGSHVVNASGEQLLKAEAPRRVAFFSLERVLQYVDDVTAAVISINIPENEKLAWVRRRDEQVRTEMVAMMNDNHNGDEALQTSWAKFAHLWVMRDWTAAAPVSEPREPRGQIRPRDEPTSKGKGKGKDKRAKLTGNDHVFKVTSMYNKQKVCGAFNGRKGCVDNSRYCPQKGLHICSYIKVNGEVCAAKDHGAEFHR